ncbi:MAG: DNA protecting protein DprA [Omnitrophica bacterium RBG_13_46_9]|nr:MAG: DNA protecting protein DprA [Omnitrophica bacterium RBG_13_46_9]
MEVTKIDKNSKAYPDNLKSIFNPPEELFVSGQILPSDDNAVAVVGTRTPTYYGLEQSEKISYELASRGITIISGMARGIDSAAHRGAIRARGRTIAVMGSGHGHIYPPENRGLYEDIVKNGAVISEFRQDMPPLKANFPRRNRIISGMSKGVVVVEAAERSGALITVDFALEQGREVFAMPGNISSMKSSGTNRLIKEGAKLIEDVRDILDELRYAVDIGQADNSVQNAGSGDRVIDMSSDEKTIFGILNDMPKSIDEISRIADFPVHKVSEVLLRLELKRLIRTMPGKNFVRV